MKLDEIVAVPPQPKHDVKLELFSNAKTICDKFMDVYTIDHGTYGPTHAFIVKKDGAFVALIVADEKPNIKTQHNKPALQIKRTWCEENMRGNSIITNLYRYVYNTLKYALVSDGEQTQVTDHIWSKLAASWLPKMVNVKTGEILPIDTSILYSSPNYSMIIESFTDNKFDGAYNDYLFVMEGFD